MTYDEFLKTLEEDSSIPEETTEKSSIIMIDTQNRQIKIPNGMEILGVTDDHKSDHVYFYIPRYYNDVDLYTKQLIIRYINPNNEYGEYIVSDMSLVTYPEDSTTPNNYIKFSWLVEQGSTLYRGTLYFSAQFQTLNGTEVEYVLQTLPAKFYIKSGIKPTSSKVCKTDTTYLQLENQIAAYEEKMDTIKNSVTEANAKILADEESIDNLITGLSTTKETVETIQNNLVSEDEKISELKDSLVTLQANYDALKLQVETNAEHIKLIEDAGWMPPDVSQTIVEIKQRLDALETNDVHYTDEE